MKSATQSLAHELPNVEREQNESGGFSSESVLNVLKLILEGGPSTLDRGAIHKSAEHNPDATFVLCFCRMPIEGSCESPLYSTPTREVSLLQIEILTSYRYLFPMALTRYGAEDIAPSAQILDHGRPGMLFSGREIAGLDRWVIPRATPQCWKLFILAM
jgi:hypothetical protein